MTAPAPPAPWCDDHRPHCLPRSCGPAGRPASTLTAVSTPELLRRLRPELEAARDPVRAAAETAYMRGQFSFFGITMPKLAAIYRSATAGLPPPDGDADLADLALACWKEPEREYQYVAVTHLQRHVRRAGPALAPTLERLVTTRSWWDTVDGLATHVMGSLVAASPELRAVTDRWIGSPDLWLARAAILHQERYGERTDAALLFDYCLRRGADREFFVRKAIGWALRSYAKSEPAAVRAFLDAHGERLSGLSRREAERGVAMGLASGQRPAK